MHISFILPDLNGGGAQKMVINMASEFSSRGYRVDLVVFNYVGDYVGSVSETINIVNLEKPRALKAIIPLCFYFKKHQPDVIVSALFHVNLITIFSKIFSFSKKSCLIISERNYFSLQIKNFSKTKYFIIKKLISFLYPFADYIVGISNGVCEDLKTIVSKKFHKKIKTIYNPVVKSNFSIKILEDIDSIYPENSRLKLITSGRLEAQKDYPTLFKALAQYKEKHGDFHLIILGKGSLEKTLQELSVELKIKDNISFLGFVDNPLACMKQADIFVISSAWEGFCNVIVEALYAGLKIVSTDCLSGPSEILSNGKYGLLSPVGDIDALCKNIHLISEQKISCETLRMRALEFTVEKKSDEFEHLFKEGY